MDCFGLEHDILSVYPYRDENIQEALCRIYSILDYLKKNGQVFDPEDWKKLEQKIDEVVKKCDSNKELIDFVKRQLELHIDSQNQTNQSVVLELNALKERITKLEGSLTPIPPKPPVIGGDCWKNGMMSAQGFRFIKSWEGFASKPYQDSTGHMTIGYGITQLYDPHDYSQLLNGGLGCTEEQASKVMYNRVTDEHAKKIIESVKAMGCDRQSQFDALVSLAYNKGNSRVMGNNELTDAIRKNPWNEAVIRPIWENFIVYPGTSAEQGLRNRRKAECDMYFGTYGKRPITKIPYSDGYVTENDGNGWLPTDCDTPTPPLGKKGTILVDAGHGLSGDPSGHPGEKYETRKIRDVLIPKLRNAGYTVVDCTVDNATSEGDQLQQIVTKANKYPDAKLFVSIHMNGYEDPSANGTEVFTVRGASAKTKEIGTAVLNGLVASMGTRNRGLKEQNFFVLTKTIAPAILCECAFLTNSGDMQKYTPEKAGEGIYQGIIKTIN